jgi:hypothetical protein
MKNKLILCKINIETRTNCKYCRYTKCVVSTGMRPQRVLQQYIPKVQTKKRSKSVDVLKKTKHKECSAHFNSNSPPRGPSSFLDVSKGKRNTLSTGSSRFEVKFRELLIDKNC